MFYCLFFFFKQKAAYEMRISDWSSDVCSSDLSTNTVLHLLAAAQEAGVDFTMSDIDRISRGVPCLCKAAPATDKYHIEDVHRAGGIQIGRASGRERGGQ